MRQLGTSASGFKSSSRRGHVSEVLMLTMRQVPMSYAEDMQVLHYAKNQHYWAHHGVWALGPPS